MRYLLTLLIVLPLNLNAAIWYLDKAATGSNAGTSMANAWSNFVSINWNGMAAGDTLEIASGDYRSFGAMSIGKAGSQSNWVTVKITEDAAKKGIARIDAFSLSSRSWIEINGALTNSYTPPASVHSIYTMTNNIGFIIDNPDGHGIFMSGATTGNKIKWCYIDNVGTNGGSGNWNAIWINGSTKQTEIAYNCLMNNVNGDGINRVLGSMPPTLGDLIVHDNIVDNVGDDVMQIAGGGAEIYRNYVTRNTRGFAGGHPDVFQTWDTPYSIHHNIIKDFHFGAGFYSSFAYAQLSDPVDDVFLLYNNLFYDEFAAPMETCWVFTVDAWNSPNKYNARKVVNRLFIANNLFHTPAARSLGIALHFDSDASRGTNDIIAFTNSICANNIIVHSSTNSDTSCFALVSTNATGERDVTYESFIFNNNVVAGMNEKVSYIKEGGWNSVSEMAAETPYDDNTDTMPTFVSFTVGSPPYNFRPHTNDTVLIGNGLDLSAWTNLATSLLVDLDGVTRTNWDIGPYTGAGDSEPPPPPDPPSAPTGLARNGGTLSWDANPPEENVSTYAVYQNINAAGWNVVGGGSDTTFDLGELAAGSYQYRVTASNLGGESDPSSTVSFSISARVRLRSGGSLSVTGGIIAQ